MRIEEAIKAKTGKCIVCNNDMLVYNKRQRFCGDVCRDAYWNNIRGSELKVKRARKRAAKKRDLFGFEVAA